MSGGDLSMNAHLSAGDRSNHAPGGGSGSG